MSLSLIASTDGRAPILATFHCIFTIYNDKKKIYNAHIVKH